MLFISDKIKHIFIVVILFILAFLFINFGWLSGKKQAQSRLIVSQAGEISKALDNFYSDNLRFPSADEFARPEVMNTYLSQVSNTAEFSVGGCPQIFSYQRPQPKLYELNFCLPAATSNFKKGWNTFSQQK